MSKRNHGKIRIGGTISVEGPDILKRLAEAKGDEGIIISEQGIEFYLRVKDAPGEDSLKEVTPWFALYEGDVEITNDVNYDNESIDAIFGLMFTGKDNRKVEIHFSIDQARIAAEFLNAYVKGYDFQASLKRSVPAQGLQGQAS